MRNICEAEIVGPRPNPMTGAASRAQNPSLRSKRVRGSALSTGTLTVATPRVRSNTTSLCNKPFTTWSPMLPKSSAIVAFPSDAVNVQYANSSLPRRAARNSYLVRGCCQYRQFKYSALRTVHMPKDEPIRSANSEYSEVQGALSKRKSRPGGSDDLWFHKANMKFTALAIRRDRVGAGKMLSILLSTRNTLTLRTDFAIGRT